MYTYKIKEIIKVVDGDTIDVAIDLGFGLIKHERVRIAGIDAPETRTRDLYEKKLGIEAKEWLIKELDGASLIIKTEKEGKYGRILGWLYKESTTATSLNEIMVNKGYGIMMGIEKKTLTY